MSRSILAAYRAEVRDAERWLKQHRLQCPACNRAMQKRDPQGRPCPEGLRIRRYAEMNQEIVDKLAATPDGDLIQGTLW